MEKPVEKIIEKPIEEQNLSKIALKNSSYVLISNFILKFGGLIFTILIARMLLPELFGVYSLALSIVSIFFTLTGLGVVPAFLRYSSEAFGKNDKKKFRGYFRFFFKVQSILTITVVLILILSAGFIANNIYDKPYLQGILIFASLYIMMESFKVFISVILGSLKYFKPLPFLDLLSQISKILFSLLAIVLFKGYFKVTGIFIAFALAGLVFLILESLVLFKKDREIFFGKRSKINKAGVKKFMGYMAIASLSLVFFTSIDILMLGKFVDVEYIGYYRVAISLVLTIATLFSLSGVIMPIFTQIHKARFKRGFQKTFRYMMIIAIPATAGIIFIGKHLIFAVYGKEYLLAATSLYFLSLLIITRPLTNLYASIFQSKDKPKILAKSVFISLIFNIVLNYIFIKVFLSYGPEYVIVGVGISTVISRIVYLLILTINAKRTLDLKVRGIGLKSPIFATLIMSLFLLVFNKFVDMNLIYGAIEIILGAGIYLGVLILTKGVKREDWEILKSLIKK